MKSILTIVFLYEVSLPALAQLPIIDMHLHAFGFDEYGFPLPGIRALHASENEKISFIYKRG